MCTAIEEKNTRVWCYTQWICVGTALALSLLMIVGLSFSFVQYTRDFDKYDVLHPCRSVLDHENDHNDTVDCVTHCALRANISQEYTFASTCVLTWYGPTGYTISHCEPKAVGCHRATLYLRKEAPHLVSDTPNVDYTDIILYMVPLLFFGIPAFIGAMVSIYKYPEDAGLESCVRAYKRWRGSAMHAPLLVEEGAVNTSFGTLDDSLPSPSSSNRIPTVRTTDL